MKVSALYAQEHFADLAIAASTGEEVEIKVYGQPTLVLHQRRTPGDISIEENVGALLLWYDNQILRACNRAINDLK